MVGLVIMSWLPNTPQLNLYFKFFNQLTSFMKFSLVMAQAAPIEPNVHHFCPLAKRDEPSRLNVP